jgi:hypothetical protein
VDCNTDSERRWRGMRGKENKIKIFAKIFNVSYNRK